MWVEGEKEPRITPRIPAWSCHDTCKRNHRRRGEGRNLTSQAVYQFLFLERV